MHHGNRMGYVLSMRNLKAHVLHQLTQADLEIRSAKYSAKKRLFFERDNL